VRVLLFGNGPVALELLGFLRASGAELGGLVVHPEGKGRLSRELIETSGLAPESIFRADRLRDPDTLGRIRALHCTLGVSIFFGYILRAPLLELLPDGVVNLHPAYLPWNRGGYPNVWSIVEGTPAGATLHWIDAGVDTGDLIARVEVPVEPWDTGQTLYWKCCAASLRVFRGAWHAIASGEAKRTRQPEGGSVHRDRDV